VKVVEAKAPSEKLESAQASVNTITPFVKTIMAECAQTEATIRSLIEAEKKKISAELLRRHCASLVTHAETLLRQLATLNSANTEAARGLWSLAETARELGFRRSNKHRTRSGTGTRGGAATSGRENL
jgi:hypothetical protein